MKIDVVRNSGLFEDWKSDSVIITQNEFLKADKKEIETVVCMLSNLNCFQMPYSAEIHNEILHNLEHTQNAKIHFGIVSNTDDTERYFEIYIKHKSKHYPVIYYNKKTDESYLVKRKFPEENKT